MNITPPSQTTIATSFFNSPPKILIALTGLVVTVGLVVHNLLNDRHSEGFKLAITCTVVAITTIICAKFNQVKSILNRSTVNQPALSEAEVLELLDQTFALSPTTDQILDSSRRTPLEYSVEKRVVHGQDHFFANKQYRTTTGQSQPSTSSALSISRNGELLYDGQVDKNGNFHSYSPFKGIKTDSTLGKLILENTQLVQYVNEDGTKATEHQTGDQTPSYIKLDYQLEQRLKESQVNEEYTRLFESDGLLLPQLHSLHFREGYRIDAVFKHGKIQYGNVIHNGTSIYRVKRTNHQLTIDQRRVSATLN